MRVKLAYGRSGMTVNMPDNRTYVIEPQWMPSIPDQGASVLHALRHSIRSAPLRELIEPNDTVAVVFCDGTQPMPSSLVVPLLLEEIDHVPAKQVVLINATGTRRANTRDELVRMLGSDVVSRYRIVNHEALDKSTLSKVGKLDDGTDVLLNKNFVQAKKRILTGFIAPHFFEGFSGGPEMVAPGLAGMDTILALHSAELIGNPQSTWGVTGGNPLWEKMCQAARLVDVTYSLNVTVNKQHHVTNVFAGEMWQSHAIGVEFARKTTLRAVPQPYDIVVTTNAGYPLDQTLYETVKGMSAAAQMVKPGGAIVVASECSEGIPDQGNYRKLLKQAGSPERLLQTLRKSGSRVQDQWEAQIQALIQLKAKVYLKAGYLSDDQIREAMLTPISNVETCVNELLEEMDSAAIVGVLPQGPMTIPFVQVREPLALV